MNESDKIMNFPKEDLIELICGGEVESLELISDTIIETSRWSILHQFIFKHEDKFYRRGYSEGATEYQSEELFENERNEIECAEVFPTTVTTTKYMTAEARKKYLDNPTQS